MIGKWQRLWVEGCRGAVLCLPHGVQILVTPRRATETGKRLWQVEVAPGARRGIVRVRRRWLCTTWPAVRHVIREELEALGAAA